MSKKTYMFIIPDRIKKDALNSILCFELVFSDVVADNGTDLF